MSRISEVKTSSGKLIGRIETDYSGNKTVTDAYGRLIGRYEAGRDVVTDVSGRLIIRGDAPGILFKDLI